MARIAALDLGDKWIGIALSDNAHIIARPHTTITASQLMSYIARLLVEYTIELILVGYPKTMRGTESEQTKKVVAQFEKLQKKFPAVEWKLWDERLTSSMAADLTKGIPTKEEKIKSHARAAAFILDSYLVSVNNYPTVIEE